MRGFKPATFQPQVHLKREKKQKIHIFIPNMNNVERAMIQLQQIWK